MHSRSAPSLNRTSLRFVVWYAALATALAACSNSAHESPDPAGSTDMPTSPSTPSAPSAPIPVPRSRHISFDDQTEGQAPRGFTFGLTGDGKPGRWVVTRADDAPSSRFVLAQADDDPTPARYPVAIAEAPKLRDLIASVRVKCVSGFTDQGAGLVFRYADDSSYYVVRANALEDDVALFHVTRGARILIQSAPAPGIGNTWHDLAIEMRGDHVVVRWDGRVVIDRKDTHVTEPGRVGVWTKADSVSWFDDLSAEPLGE
ncbi:MAG: hypothetical protein K8T90_11300 [Planctomycetes bacterium]|nr:hypothetical protein [Planctomycetota bacterium]